MQESFIRRLLQHKLKVSDTLINMLPEHNQTKVKDVQMRIISIVVEVLEDFSHSEKQPNQQIDLKKVTIE